MVEQIRDLAREDSDPLDGPLRLGVIPTLGPYLVPHLLPALRRRAAELRLFLREDLTANLLERLRQCRLDAALLALPVADGDLEVLELFHEPFVVALPQDNPLVGKTCIRAEDLDTENLLLLEEGHCLRDHALALCGGACAAGRDELKATSLETLRQMVAAGVGCTLLPALAAQPRVGTVPGGLVQCRPFAAPGAVRRIGLVWRRHYPREQTALGIADVILANLPAVVAPCRPPRATPRLPPIHRLTPA